MDAQDFLTSLIARCEGAYSQRTLGGYRSDLKLFAEKCQREQVEWLPTTPESLASFINEQSKNFAISTVKRRVEAIKFAHRLIGHTTPMHGNDVRLALRRLARNNASRPKQSLGVTFAILEKILAALPNTIAGRRDAALISVGYDALARSYELVSLTVSDLRDDFTTISIRRSKSDREGVGRLLHLSPRSSVLVKEWLALRGTLDGPLFQGLHTGRPSGKVLNTSSVRRIVKRAAKRAGLPQAEIDDLSGHSMRVGAAQDMMVAGLNHIAIMQAGGWSSIDVVARYVENASAKKLQQERWDALSRSANR